jgi:hypothetical protein
MVRIPLGLKFSLLIRADRRFGEVLEKCGIALEKRSTSGVGLIPGDCPTHTVFSDGSGCIWAALGWYANLIACHTPAVHPSHEQSK